MKTTILCILSALIFVFGTLAFSVYFLAGKGDYSVCQKDAQSYYEKITAQDKAFYWIENAGHSMFMDTPKQYCGIIKEILEKLKYIE